jgi:hypothetical protein
MKKSSSILYSTWSLQQIVIVYSYISFFFTLKRLGALVGPPNAPYNFQNNVYQHHGWLFIECNCMPYCYKHTSRWFDVINPTCSTHTLNLHCHCERLQWNQQWIKRAEDRPVSFNKSCRPTYFVMLPHNTEWAQKNFTLSKRHRKMRSTYKFTPAPVDKKLSKFCKKPLRDSICAPPPSHAENMEMII